jgi:hypothetical protein
MNQELEQTLLNISQLSKKYSEDRWYLIIDSLLDDFQEFIGFNFKRSSRESIFLDINYSDNPGFSTNFWTSDNEKKDNSYSPIWIKCLKDHVCSERDDNYCSSIKWIGIMSGGISGVIKQKKYEDIFCLSITFFLFDPISKKRLYINNEKGFLKFYFVPQVNFLGEWQILGWFEDEFEEWDHINSWDDLLI